MLHKEPPSLSSQQARLGTWAGLREVLASGPAWLVAVGCSVPQGISVAWTAIMVINMTEVCSRAGDCLTQHWVNYLGITSVVVGTMVAICVGMVTDRIKGKMKVTILGLLVLGRKMK